MTEARSAALPPNPGQGEQRTVLWRPATRGFPWRGMGGRPRGIGGHTALLLLAALGALPVYWMLVASLRTPEDMLSPSLFPAHPTLANYAAVLADVPMLRMLANTVVVAASVTACQLLTALLAAHGFVRWRFRLRRPLYLLLALSWLVPFQATMIPNYMLLARLGRLDTLDALILPHVASALAVILLCQAMRAFPLSIIEAARIDGAGSWAVLWRVVVPNLRANLASLAILLFISSWNEYLWPLLVTRQPEHAVVQIGLQMFMTAEGNLWGPLMAAATLASLPVLLLYLVLHRQVIDSFMHSGLRG